MKSARGIWIGIVALALVLVAAYAVVRRQAPDKEFQSTDEFLAAARKAAEVDQGHGAETGFVPGTNEKEGLPQIDLGMTTLDLGLVPHTKITVVDFPIKNKGTGTLVISDIGTTCHCTEGAMAEGQNVIKAGGQGTMKVSLNPDRVPDGFWSHKQLSIHSNDPQHPLVTLDVLSKVDPEFSIEPETVEFGEVAKGQAVTKTLRVRQIYDGPFEVTKIVPVHPEDEKKFELSFEKLPESEWAKPDHVEYNVKVALPATLSVGALNSAIRVNNTCKRPNIKEFYVPVTANVKAFYRLSTPKLVIPATDVTPGKTDIGSLTIDADKPFELSGLSVSEPLLTAAAKAGDKPNSQVISISLSPLAVPGVRNGDIHFTITSGGESFSESVPVQVVVPTVRK